MSPFLLEVAQIAVVSGPNRQVKVVGHEAIGKQTDRRPLAGLVKKVKEGDVIPVLVKDGAASVATVQDVVAIPPFEARRVRGIARLSRKTKWLQARK